MTMLLETYNENNHNNEKMDVNYNELGEPQREYTE